MRASLFSLHYAWEPCVWKQRVMGGGQKGRGYGSHTPAHTHTHTASQGHWPTPKKPKILMNGPLPHFNKFRSSPINTNGGQNQTVCVGDMTSQVLVGVATLSSTFSSTSPRTQTSMRTLFGLVLGWVFKSTEVFCKSTNFVSTFTPGCKEKKKEKRIPLGWLFGHFSHFQLHLHSFLFQIVLI